MKRPFFRSFGTAFWSCLTLVAALLGPSARAGNVLFNFNKDAEGFTFGTIPSGTSSATPVWEWHDLPSSTDGGLQALFGTATANSGAWTMSPCLQLAQNSNQEYVHVDLTHLFNFPETTGNPPQPIALGQVQFRIDTTGTWGNWQGVPITAWDSSSNHVNPTEPEVFIPLLSSGGTNTWWAFSGTSPDPVSGPGSHIQSQFDIQWADYGLQNGDEIQFRFVAATDQDLEITQQELWEVTRVQIDGVEICTVPEPGTMAMVAGAGVMGLGGLARRRLRLRLRAAKAAA